MKKLIILLVVSLLSAIVFGQTYLIDEGFNAGTTAPSGWIFTNIGGTYTSLGNYGASSPSLKLDATGDAIETTSFADATNLSFWIKGQGISGTNHGLLVEEYYTSGWHTIENVTPISNTAVTKSYSLNAATTKVKVTFTKGTGNIAFDDLKVWKPSSSNSIIAGAVSTPPFYVDSNTQATGSVAFTSTGTYSSATFTANLSDASGSFASPTDIGTTTVSGTNPSGSISITIPTGTTEGTGYKIRIDCGTPAVTGTESAAFIIQNGAKNVTGASSTVNSGTLTVLWTNPTTIYDEIMIVAKATTSISGTPSGNGSAYTPSLTFGSGTGFDSGFVVYKGNTSPQTITGLSNGTLYYVKLFTRKNSNWSAGVEISNTPAVQPALTDVIVPQYMQGVSGTNNNRIPTALRLKLDNLSPNATYRYASQFVLASSLPTYDGAGTPVYVLSDGTFVRTTSPGLSTVGTYGEFTTDATGSYEGWFMGEPTGNATVFPVGNEVYLRIRLNDGNNGTTVVTRLTTTSPIKVINFGTQDNVNQGTFLFGVSQTPAKNFAFVYDNEAGTGRPIAGSVIESDGVDLSAITSILSAYRTTVDAVTGAWGVIIPNSVGAKGFTGIKRVESRNLSDGTIYAENTDADGVWGDVSTVNPLGGSSVPLDLTGEATLPVELSSFTATMTAQNTVSIMWVTQSETNVNGYYVHRGVNSELSAATIVSPLIAATNTSQQQYYQFTDSDIFEPGTYYYWLQAQDLDGSIVFHGPTTVYYDNGSNPGTPVIPKFTELKSIYPNPFNPSTTFSYSLANSAEVSFVIYNGRGQIVRSFNEGNKGIGNHSLLWNGEDQYGRSCSTGIYYIKMTAGKDSFIRKAVLMK